MTDGLPIDFDLLTPEEEDRILKAVQTQLGEEWGFKSLEDLFTSPHGFGLTTATPLQRAICRIVEGAPLGGLARNPEVRKALNIDDIPELGKPPAEMVILAAIRTAKSMIAAAAAIWMARTCTVDFLTDGEIPRVSILSLTMDNARVVLAHLLGALHSPALSCIRVDKKADSRWKELIAESGADAVGSVFVWHESGRPVEIRVVAGQRAGGSLVSRWSAGAIFDEAPRMVGSADAVINYDDAKRAVRARILPGAQILSLGSPYQPYGPIYDLVQEHWGSPNGDLVVLKATGPAMNPHFWTESRCAEIRRADPVVFATDVLAEFADAEESLFPQRVLVAASRNNADPIPYDPRCDYSAAMDPATRGNGWTFVVMSRRGRKKVVAAWHEWVGSTLEPLNPRQVIREIRDILAAYRLDWCFTDQWSADTIRRIGFEEGLNMIVEDWNAKEKRDLFLSLAAALADRSVELPNDPQIHKDLKMVKKKASVNGPSIQLARTSDGRHCDYAPALARAVWPWLRDETPEEPAQGTPEYWKRWEEEQVAIEIEKHKNTDWWDTDVEL